MTVNVVPTPVYGHGMVYLTSGFRGAALQAVRVAEAKGEVTGTAADASPAVAGGEIYLRGSAHLYCLAEGGAKEAAAGS
jgi:hypothetical protein